MLKPETVNNLFLRLETANRLFLDLSKIVTVETEKETELKLHLNSVLTAWQKQRVAEYFQIEYNEAIMYLDQKERLINIEGVMVKNL